MLFVLEGGHFDRHTLVRTGIACQRVLDRHGVVSLTGNRHLNVERKIAKLDGRAGLLHRRVFRQPTQPVGLGRERFISELLGGENGETRNDDQY